MTARSQELIAKNESTIITEPFLDAVVVEDSEGNGCFSNPTCPDESDGFHIFNVSDDLLDELFASNQVLGGGGNSPGMLTVSVAWIYQQVRSSIWF